MTQSCTTGRRTETTQRRDGASPSLMESGMQASEDPFRRRSAMAQATLVAALLVMFLLLHVLAGAVLQRAGAPDRSPSTQDLTLKPYD